MRTHKFGFTLVEILVVVSIIGILMGLVMAGVFPALRTVRTRECSSNQQQVAKAILTYESVNGVLPGYVNTIVPPKEPSKWMNVSWVVSILPQLGREDLWNEWKKGTGGNTAVMNANISFLKCPENPPVGNTARDTPLAFVVNGGQWGYNYDSRYPALRRAYGVFFNRSGKQVGQQILPVEDVTISTSSIKDGVTQTLMLSENASLEYKIAPPSCWGMPPSNGTWKPGWYGTGSSSTDPTQKLAFWWHKDSTNLLNKVNRDPKGILSPAPPCFARPASFHGGGVNACFLDGHAHFLREEIDPYIYQHLCTPDSVAAGITTAPPAEGEF